MSPTKPWVSVHIITLREAVCYACGWASEPMNSSAEADAAAEAHRCSDGK